MPGSDGADSQSFGSAQAFSWPSTGGIGVLGGGRVTPVPGIGAGGPANTGTGGGGGVN